MGGQDSVRLFYSRTQEGEVLGVWLDTFTMMVQLPRRKVVPLVACVLEAVCPGAELSLQQLEVIHGRLNNFAQLAPPLKLLVGETLQFLRDLLEEYLTLEGDHISRS